MMQTNSRIFSNLSAAIRYNFKINCTSVPTQQACTRKFHYASSFNRLQNTDVVRLTRNKKFNRTVTPNFNYIILVRSESTSVNSSNVVDSLSPSPSSPVLPSVTEATPTLLPNDGVIGAEVVSTLGQESSSESLSVILADKVPTISSEVSETLGYSPEILNVASGTENVGAPVILDSIPEPPAIPEAIEEFFSAAAPAFEGEQSLASLGLAGWSPPGIAQQCLEFIHLTFGLPWWASILTGTVIVRILLFPLVVKSQRNAAKMSNNMPQIQLLQMKMTEARQTGNALMAAKYGNDMMMFMKEKDISPFKSMLVPLAMAPVFMSFFFGLRSMANLPVDSLKTGGMFWFTDLTLADPMFILPLVTSVTMWITLEIGVDGARLSSSPHGGLMKYFLRALPIIMFPFTMNFPAAILCYWVSTNAASLVQVSFLKIPAVRQKLNIEALLAIPKSDLPVQNKGFVKSFKDSWTNIKITKEMEERERYDDISFKRAGRGPIPKTYKYDPTKVTEAIIQAKKK